MVVLTGDVRTRRTLLAAGFLRSMAIALAGVLLGLWLAERRLSAAAAGLVIGCGLAGTAAGALLVTLADNRLPLRRALLAFGACSAIGAALLPFAGTRPSVLVAVAFLGMVNGMGRDRGPASVLEQSLLPATAAPAQRTRAIAWYTALQDAGSALGSLAALLFASTLRTGLVAHALLLAVSALLYLRLPRQDTPTTAPRVAPLSPTTRRFLTRLCLLFAVDGLGGGFLTTGLLTWFYATRFGVGAESLAPLFFASRLANVLSHFAAAWLSRRIGLVNTMVWTHLPSSLLLPAIAFAPSFPLAAACHLLRECLVEMDVPTRTSYTLALVRPEERTAAAGWTNLTRLTSWALGPAIAGALMGTVALAAPLLAAAATKISYDLMLWRSFRRLPPPEELAP
ncbi:MAG TPA: MFS transporter [Thermoanaerobaculia bacterium]|nr:MFS transporter [Thermoanaerobaculia bacterium]